MIKSANLYRILWGCVCSFALLGQAVAHHSTAKYDYSKTVTLIGTVKQFQWTNPHCYVQVFVPDEQGKDVEWAIETGVPALSSGMGWTKNSLKPGDKVSLLISPERDGSHGGTLRTVTLADGTVLRGAAAGGPPGGLPK